MFEHGMFEAFIFEHGMFLCFGGAFWRRELPEECQL